MHGAEDGSFWFAGGGVAEDGAGAAGRTVEAMVRSSSTMAAKICQPAVSGGPSPRGDTCTAASGDHGLAWVNAVRDP